LKTKQIYDPKSIEPRWQKYWAENKVYQPDLQAAKKPLDKTLGKPFYNLMMFPYPSAEGLHVGNMYAFTGADVYGRFQRMQGYDVFEPIGLDGFGIHSENYAIKVGRHPAEHAKVSEKHFYEQLHMIGNGFAWDQKLETYDPDYYRWTQWLFVQMYKHGLAYRKKAMVNWCPSCKTVLSDEQVEGGICERCKTATTRKETEQWFFRITKYANRLLENLEKIDWPGKIKIAQRNWIGKKEGALVEFKIQSSKFETKVEAFTTRIDTIFGVTFLVVAPEIAKEWISRGWKASARVSKYVQESLDKPNEERKKGEKEKTGIDTGLKAVNLASREKMPVLVADYVLKDVGTGVVMGVPAHDQRDFEFAIKMNLIVKPVIRPKFVQNKLDKDCLENLLEIIRMAKKDNKRLIVGGGWIVDAYLGLRIRNHTDIDMYVPYREVDYWQKYFLGRHFVVNNHKGLNKDERYYKSFSFQVPKEQKYLWVDVVGIGIERGQMFDMEEGKKEFWGMSEEEAIFEGEIQGEKVECLSPKFKIKSILECKRAMKVTEPEKDYAKYDLDLEMLGNKALTREGILFNSGKYNGIDTRLAKGQMIENGLGKRFVSYHLRDWLISRQRYWGPPIPMIFCKNCADKKSSGQSTINNQQPTMSGWFPVTEEQLPVLLPYVKDFQPLGEGKTPLQKAPKEWLKVKCPNCGKMAERSTEVSDTFLDSSWYFLAKSLALSMIARGRRPAGSRMVKRVAAIVLVISHLNVTEEISVRHGKGTIISPLFHKTFLPECKTSLIFTLSLYGIFRYLTKIHPKQHSPQARENREMGSHSRPHNDTAGGAIDRKRERERRYMMQMLYKNADELATKMVQRLLDKKILEITDETAMRKLFSELFEKLSNMEEFDMLYKIAPLRQLVADPSFLSLYVTQYICEDLVENDKVQDVYGDDLEIYQAVESVFKVLRPQN